MEAIDEKDVGYYEAFGKLYRKARAGQGDGGRLRAGDLQRLDVLPSRAAVPGGPALGRGARPRDLAEPKNRERRRPTAAEDKKKTDDSSDPNAAKGEKKPAKNEEKRGEEEREQLKWFDEHAPEAFVAWQAVEHPDFPGRRVEVGGYRPFVLTNPPAAMLAEIAAKQGDFLTELARRLPRIGIGKIECRLLADSIYEIEILVVNTGFLPTALAHGETTQEVYPTRVILDLEPACFLAGAKTTFLPTIAGSGGTAKARYTIHVANRQEVHFEVVSMLAGRVEGTIELLKAAENK